jgi:hypothetical protein
MASSAQMRYAVLHSLPSIRLGSRTAFTFQSLLCGLSIQMTAAVAKAGTALWLHPRKCGLPFFIHYRPFV